MCERCRVLGQRVNVGELSVVADCYLLERPCDAAGIEQLPQRRGADRLAHGEGARDLCARSWAVLERNENSGYVAHRVTRRKVRAHTQGLASHEQAPLMDSHSER